MAVQQIDGGRQVKSGTITGDRLVAATVADDRLATSYVKADGTRALTGDWSAGNNAITNVKDAVSAQDAVNLRTAQALVQGLDVKQSVRVATTATGTLASSFANGSTVDGVTLATNDRILIKDQSSGAENGIYTVNASGAPTRATDADTNGKVTSNLFVFVEEGTTNADSGWTLTNNGAITLGSTALSFTQFSGAGQITVDSTIVKTGNQLKRAPLTGDVTAADGSNSTVIANAAVTLAKMANLAANSVIANNTGSGATPIALGLTSAATASTAMYRDTNGNVRLNALIENLQAVTSAAGTTTLTVASPRITLVTGSTTQIVKLPDATTLVVGQQLNVINRSSGVVTVNDNSNTLVQTMAAGSFLELTCTGIGTAAGTWDAAYTFAGGSGTVTTVSVATANGFAGTVATATTTPAITLTTSVTGIVKGNGTALSAATPGTDYLAPAGRITRETPSGSVNGSNTTFTLANTPTSGTEEVYLNGVQQEPGAGNDYTISGATITYLTAPLSGDKIRVSYFK